MCLPEGLLHSQEEDENVSEECKETDIQDSVEESVDEELRDKAYGLHCGKYAGVS